MTLNEFDAYLNSFLKKEDFAADPSRNGIQIQNSAPDLKEIKTVAFAVDACEATALVAAKEGADVLLEQMTDRDAEWHYLKGIIYLRKGWMDGARSEFSSAYQMDPTNMEFTRAYRTMDQMGGFRNFYGSTADGCNLDNLCLGLCLMDLCCGNRGCR